MFEWFIRDYENIVRRPFKQRGGIIENENSERPIPGVIKLSGGPDLISQIFDADAKGSKQTLVVTPVADANLNDGLSNQSRDDRMLIADYIAIGILTVLVFWRGMRLLGRSNA